MIFYTLKGPSYRLEIHDSKLILIKRLWWRLITIGPSSTAWELQNLESFRVVKPKTLFWGKLEWRNLQGRTESFRFSTNAEMVQRIEKYFQKVVSKNLEKSVHSPNPHSVMPSAPLPFSA